MPERRPLLRRAAYLAAVTTTIGVFAGSLAGIASTQGQAKPNGDAAALAAQAPTPRRRPHVGPRPLPPRAASHRHRRRRSARSSGSLRSALGLLRVLRRAREKADTPHRSGRDPRPGSAFSG